eukprot:gnl/Chilomastix_caulleri/4757.p1 GENE.gnl/Chilomastix_caulleri/4757~~gnl/Chilomastix_caulleri/4757.p1  ORF type:complete len:217 (+),score=27.89 gnl/Chilomastix_caulleri/4757:119-769(+)
MSSRWCQTDENGTTFSKKSIVTNGANKRELEVGDIIALFLDVKLGGVIVLRNGTPIANSVINGTFTGSGKVISDPREVVRGKNQRTRLLMHSTLIRRPVIVLVYLLMLKASRESFRCELLSVVRTVSYCWKVTEVVFCLVHRLDFGKITSGQKMEEVQSQIESGKRNVEKEIFLFGFGLGFCLPVWHVLAPHSVSDYVGIWGIWYDSSCHNGLQGF